jgi:predicted ATP-grasp superfamily ATP-dependent carboligase
MPDPEGAAVLIEALNNVYGLKVDTKELLNKAEEIKKKLKEVAQRHRRMRKAEEKRGVPEKIYV